jgi:hypothetical protein
MEDKKFEVKYSGNAYNIFEFLNHHPGGINYITPCEKKEVTQRMHQTQHAKAAYYLLREYRVGGRDTSSEGDQEDLEVLDFRFVCGVIKLRLSGAGRLGQTHAEPSGQVGDPIQRMGCVTCRQKIEIVR